MARSLANDEYNIPARAPGKRIAEQLKDGHDLLGTLGTRIMIDENGEYVVVSFGQAQPRRSSPSRTQSALQLAKQIAAGRARGHIIHFIKESLYLRDGEASSQQGEEYSDQNAAVENIREFRRGVQSHRVRIRLRGVHVVKEWTMKHPETGQPVAGTVVAWSPAARRQVSRMEEVMRASKRQVTTAPQSKQAEQPKRTKVDIQSMPVDTSAY